MPGGAAYRALTLDLWFTTCYHTAEDAASWDAARLRVLRTYLARPRGPTLTEAEIAEAAQVVGSGLRVNGHSSVTSTPATVLDAVARQLNAEVVGAPGEASHAMGLAGLMESPPRLNPEAEPLLRGLERQGIPAVLVTNSARPASAWRDCLRSRLALPVRDVVSSCDLGVAKPDPAIFRAAARLLDLPPRSILHVGDRWELDIVGAVAAGFDAALYRGLWSRYPNGMYDSLPAPPSDLGGTRVVDDLRTLLEPEWWSA